LKGVKYQATEALAISKQRTKPGHRDAPFGYLWRMHKTTAKHKAKLWTKLFHRKQRTKTRTNIRNKGGVADLPMTV